MRKWNRIQEFMDETRGHLYKKDFNTILSTHTFPFLSVLSLHNSMSSSVANVYVENRYFANCIYCTILTQNKELEAEVVGRIVFFIAHALLEATVLRSHNCCWPLRNKLLAKEK